MASIDFPGIKLAGIDPRDKAYITHAPVVSNVRGDINPNPNQGFDLQQWFIDHGITEGPKSYYQYAQIRGLSQDQFIAGAGGYQDLNREVAYGITGGLQQLYTYTGTAGADVGKRVGPQNVDFTSPYNVGLDSYGRPLPKGIQSPAQLAALRQANITGGQSTVSGGRGIGIGAGISGTDMNLPGIFNLSTDVKLGTENG